MHQRPRLPRPARTATSATSSRAAPWTSSGSAARPCAQLLERGLVKDLADIYALTPIDLAGARGLRREVDREPDDARSRPASGRASTGSCTRSASSTSATTVARLLADHYGALEPLLDADRGGAAGDQGHRPRGGGARCAASSRTPRNRKVLERLEQAGVRPVAEKKAQGPAAAGGRDHGVHRRRSSSMTRPEARGRPRPRAPGSPRAISKKVTLVVAGPGAGSKLDEAKKLGITVIDEAAFLKRIGKGDRCMTNAEIARVLDAARHHARDRRRESVPRARLPRGGARGRVPGRADRRRSPPSRAARGAAAASARTWRRRSATWSRPAPRAIYDELKAKIPLEVVELTELQGLGPKRVKTLFEKLGVRNRADLEAAAQRGQAARAAGLRRDGREERAQGARGREPVRSGRMLLAGGLAGGARSSPSTCAQVPGVEQVEIAGSFRRRRETVGDLDLLVVRRRRRDGDGGVHHATATVAEVLGRGETKSSVRLGNGLQVDLRLVPPESFGAALLYFTGSKEHNIELRKIAIEQRPDPQRVRAHARRDVPWRAAPRRRSTARSAWRGSRPSCARRSDEIDAGARRPAAAADRARRTCAPTSTCTPTAPTAATRSRPWCARRAIAATRTARSPSTRRRSAMTRGFDEARVRQSVGEIAAVRSAGAGHRGAARARGRHPRRRRARPGRRRRWRCSTG